MHALCSGILDQYIARCKLTVNHGCFNCSLCRRHGISYYNPQLEGWNTHYIPLEAALKDSCRLLLYVITEDTRAMTSMIEVRVER